MDFTKKIKLHKKITLPKVEETQFHIEEQIKKKKSGDRYFKTIPHSFSTFISFAELF